jgi:ubiquinone biosynthesis protein COQ9
MLRLLVVMLALTFSPNAYSADDWQGLNSWLGKYPSEKQRGAALLDQASVKATLKAILPKAEQAILARLDVEAPVKDVAGYLLIEKCLPHNCPGEFAMIVIDVSKQKLWAGFFTREEKRVATRWYGNADDYATLPEAIKTRFLAKHGQ